MAERESIVMIAGSFNATDAVCVIASLTGDLDARVESEIVYPYYCFDAECSLPTLAGRKTMNLLCLVDAVNGLGSTADSFQLKNERVAASRVLDVETGAEESTRVAQQTVTHYLGRRLRTISDFDVRLTARGLVHKRFWIVQTSDARLLVDSTTGAWTALKLMAA